MTDKHQKFVKLAEKRVTRAMRELRLIGNLSNRHNYSYTEKDAQKILGVLESELKLLKNRFSSDDGRTTPVFKL